MFCATFSNCSVRACLLAALRVWLRMRWLVLVLLGLASAGYALSLVRTPETINRAAFYWFIYTGGLLIIAGLVEQGNNLERRG